MRQIGIELSDNRQRAVITLGTHCAFCDREEVESVLLDLAAVHSRMVPKWVAGIPGSPMPMVIADAA